jgi:GntR family transcriptional repressor for pyruvate dehydrogenase complex
MTEPSHIEPVRRTRLSHLIVQQLCGLIRETRLRPGDRLPPERDLAEQLHVSRASLREALRSMEIAGLVESRHGGGTYVRDALSWDAVSPLALVLQASDDTVGDLWEVRLIIEPEIAARAALRATPEDLSSLESLLKRQKAAVGKVETSLGLDREFHKALAKASHNSVALLVVELIGAHLREGRIHFVASRDRQLSALRCHTEILDAVRARNPESARAAMLHHLQEVEAYIMAAFVDGLSKGNEVGPVSDAAGTGPHTVDATTVSQRS